MTMQNSDCPGAIGRTVADCIPGILKHQQPDGAIVLDPKAPFVFAQQAIFPLAFCHAGLDPDRRWKDSPDVAAAIRKLTGFLLSRSNEKGEMSYESYGFSLKNHVDQRLTYAWLEGLRILREAGGDFDYRAWETVIRGACQTIIERNLSHLIGIRRFVGRYAGTGMNHVALYLPLVYRAGMLLNRPDFTEVALPIARALAADVHPDGYWEEHGDLLRRGGPTNLYNTLSHGGMALMAEWTGEPVFRAAVERSTHFHSNFSHPDATTIELFDERVRMRAEPMIWGLFGFTHTAEGRGVAIAHFKGWRASIAGSLDTVSPELLARCCENFMYWHRGDIAPAPFERRDHAAHLVLPGAVFRRGSWCVGLSCIAATTPEDPAYRENCFALDRQKIFSIWHEKTALLIDGAHSKYQPENSTFSAQAKYAADFYVCGGTVGEDGGRLVAAAAYKTFFGTVRIGILSDTALEIELSVDPAGNRGPFNAGFTLARRGDEISALSGAVLKLGDGAFTKDAKELGGGFSYAGATIKGPAGFQLHWPLQPFNQYAADHKSSLAAWQPRVSVELTPDAPRAVFSVQIDRH